MFLNIWLQNVTTYNNLAIVTILKKCTGIYFVDTKIIVQVNWLISDTAYFWLFTWLYYDLIYPTIWYNFPNRHTFEILFM